MNRIAFIMGDQFLYWNSIVLVLSVLCTILMFWALELRKPGDRKAAVAAVPLAVLLSMVLARLVHWYCRPQGYSGALSALSNFREGGYALIGVFAGCLLTALILHLCRVSHNTPALLDHMAIAGCLGISVGRLADLFTSADRGMRVAETVSFPWATTLYNGVSGETELRLAVFMIQAIVAAVLFSVLLVFYVKGKSEHTLPDGEVTLIFLLFYCASQAVLDSPRYDSLYFRSNGFVSVVQIFSILTVLGILIVYTVRLFKAGQVMKFFIPLMTLPLLIIAGYMEYHVQRHGGEAVFAYTVMSISMVLAVILGLVTRYLAIRRKKRRNFYG